MPTKFGGPQTIGEECREGIARGGDGERPVLEVGIAQRRRRNDVGGGAIE